MGLISRASRHRTTQSNSNRIEFLNTTGSPGGVSLNRRGGPDLPVETSQYKDRDMYRQGYDPFALADAASCTATLRHG